MANRDPYKVTKKMLAETRWAPARYYRPGQRTLGTLVLVRVVDGQPVETEGRYEMVYGPMKAGKSVYPASPTNVRMLDLDDNGLEYDEAEELGVDLDRLPAWFDPYSDEWRARRGMKVGGIQVIDASDALEGIDLYDEEEPPVMN